MLKCQDCELEFPEKKSTGSITAGDVNPKTGAFENVKPVPINNCPRCSSVSVKRIEE